jgi:hypothetical protein
MKNVHYVQRLQKPYGTINPFSFGGGLINGGLSDEAMNLLKNIFSFDYMGSAEFEWGAVPTAIKQLFTDETTISSKLDVNGRAIYIICPSGILTDVIEWVLIASQDKQGQLKEHLGLKDSLLSNTPSNVGWLKIEADKHCTEPFMFFIDKDMFDGVCKLFNVKQSELV